MYKLSAPGLYAVLIALIVLISNCAPAQSQQGQLGDATVTPGSPSKAEPYGINSSEDIGTTNFTTRHHREGNEGGIGSSFLGTTSATVESRPVSRYASPAPIASPAASLLNALNKPRSFSETMLYSPALAPMFYAKPVSADLTGASNRSVESGKMDSLPYNMFWGHQEPWGSFQPAKNTFRGSELLPH